LLVSVLHANNVQVHGPADGRPMLFAHGFGCDQEMWRYVWPEFADEHRVVLADHVGHGGSDRGRFDPARYATLQGYAGDLLAIATELDLRDTVLVGHSVSAMIGALAVTAAPERFGALVMVSPSPRYLDDEGVGYRGGFSAQDIDELLASLDSNYLGWSSAIAPVIMGNPDRPELGRELENSFCATDPEIARHFARVTFLSDNRADLAHVPVPTLVLQCLEDAIAPTTVGAYVAAALPDARLVYLDAVGHCPNLSAPQATTTAIREFLAQ
jgi:sigma-B regulation protein RsbQ